MVQNRTKKKKKKSQYLECSKRARREHKCGRTKRGPIIQRLDHFVHQLIHSINFNLYSRSSNNTISLKHWWDPQELNFFSFEKRGSKPLYLRPPMAHPCTHWIGSRWQSPSLNTAAFLPILSPVPSVLHRNHVEVQRETCRVFVHRKATSFVPLVTMTPDSCWVRVINREAISSGPLLWIHPGNLIPVYIS